MGKEEKLSFSFSSKKPASSSSSQPKRPLPAISYDDHASAAGVAEAKTNFVSVFDPSQPLPLADSSKPVIAPIPNSDYRKKFKTFLPHEEDEQTLASTETKFVLDSNSSGPADPFSYGLTLRPSNPNASETPELRREDLTLKRFKQDMKSLADDRGFHEFADVAVEDFGAAILAGYGWTEGKGIGRNREADTKVVQYDRRAGTAGLGYNPSVNDPIRKKKKGGYEVNKAAASQAAKEESVLRVVRVVSGRYCGMKAEVLNWRQGPSGVVLKLEENGKEVRVDEKMVAELGSEEEERCLRKLKELEIDDRKEGKERRREGDGERKGHGDSDRSRGRREEDGDRKGRGDSNQKRESRERSPIRWLQRHIRVRVISEDFKGGKWYLKKGEVVDVVGGTTCDLMMDGSKEILRVNQDILETALPKGGGGSVLVLYGKHKGMYGSLVEKDMKKETGIVRDADSHELVNVKLEQIAEYIGDPSDLDY